MLFILPILTFFSKTVLAQEHLEHHEHSGELGEFLNHANELMTLYLNDIVLNGLSSPFLLSLFLIAFLYGFFHSLMPGHGKLVMVTYFSVTGKKWYHGVLWGATFAVSHIFSAVFLVVLSDSVIRGVTGHEAYEFELVENVSFSAIALIGLYICIKSIRSILGSYKDDCLCGHCGHSHHSEHSHEGTLLAMLFGAIPCSGAILIMLYSLSKGVVWYGALTCLFISIGMFFCISIVALFSLYAKEGIQKLIKSNKVAKVSVFIRLLIGAIITFVGVSHILL
jgi:ABC-type nickel/cobalt efflux system permease component RcnA